MADLWTVVLPILIVDVANPVLLAAVILAVSTKRPSANSLAVIAGHTFSYTLFGILIVFGLAGIGKHVMTPIQELIDNPEPGNATIALLIGLVLVWIAWKQRSETPLAAAIRCRLNSH